MLSGHSRTWGSTLVWRGPLNPSGWGVPCATGSMSGGPHCMVSQGMWYVLVAKAMGGRCFIGNRPTSGERRVRTVATRSQAGAGNGGGWGGGPTADARRGMVALPSCANNIWPRRWACRSRAPVPVQASAASRATDWNRSLVGRSGNRRGAGAGGAGSDGRSPSGNSGQALGERPSHTIAARTRALV